MGCCHSKAVVSMRVQDRDTGRMIDETIPSYLRSVYRVMYQNPVGRKLIKFPVTTALLRKATARHGVKMDTPESSNQIAKFIETYGVNVDEVERPLSEYSTFNDFFARRLKAGARPIACPDDSSVMVSPADCRLLVFPSLGDTTRFWLKGQDFTVAELLGPQLGPLVLSKFHNPAVAIARLAPQDYHRWHMPLSGVVGPRASVEGTYFSVSPRAVREVNILCTNKREVCLFESGPVEEGGWGTWAMIAVGAAMVSSILIEDSMKEGARVAKGEEHGQFRFGGSTLILLFDAHAVVWDEDLVSNSRKPIESYVKQGSRIGRQRTVVRNEQARAAAASGAGAAAGGFQHRARLDLDLDESDLSFPSPRGLVSPSPSPVSPRLVHTATTDSARKEAALNDEGLIHDLPLLQSNLTLLAREGDTVPSRGVPNTTRANMEAAEAVSADTSSRRPSTVEQLLPSFLGGISPSSSPESPESPSSASSSGSSFSSPHASLLSGGGGRGGRSASAASAASAAAAAEPSSPVPAPAVFHLVQYTGDEEPEGGDEGSEGASEESEDEEMRESNAEARSRQDAMDVDEEKPAPSSSRNSGSKKGRGSSNKKQYSHASTLLPPPSAAAASSASSSNSSASRQSRRRTRSGDGKEDSAAAASQQPQQQADEQEQQPVAKKKAKRGSRK